MYKPGLQEEGGLARTAVVIRAQGLAVVAGVFRLVCELHVFGVAAALFLDAFAESSVSSGYIAVVA